ncbi:hypothetical protein MF628_004939 [Paenibacillus polymyxa]|uniref:hypothetical protein n=1 Tax=Paenibacillus polymyxa TaxID=1406 RepID=UPI00202585D9|nr:hypothetical protein [Paenibacillus polymyxa]URJ45157.1 hypothetical protein MF628_004939 [Paenibacillus polymyxa]
MTDKPERLISADKLLEWAEYETWELYCDLKAEIECNTFDPEPPQQPDIQVGARNWQEDMELSEQAKGWTFEITFNDEGNIVAKDANYTFAQVIAGDVGISNAEIILDGLEALPYWLQQAKFEKERAMGNYNWAKYEERRADEATERHKAASRDRDAVYKKLNEAESLIQQKDAEIAELKRLAEFWESQYSDASTHGDETEERLNAEIAAAEKAYEGLQANCVSRGEYEAMRKKLDDMTKAYRALTEDTP